MSASSLSRLYHELSKRGIVTCSVAALPQYVRLPAADPKVAGGISIEAVMVHAKGPGNSGYVSNGKHGKFGPQKICGNNISKFYK